jgi:UDP-glucose 4-epimerase
MRYVVTGGAGFIGSHLADELIRDGHEVTILDNLTSGKEDNINPAATFVHGSITDLPHLEEVFDGADGVFHQAAIASIPLSIRMPVFINEVNLTGTLNVLSAAQMNGVKKVVFASSASVYGNNPAPNRECQPDIPRSPYAVSKVAGEHYMNLFTDLYGMDTVSLRYFNVYGSRQQSGVIPEFVRQITNRKPITIHGSGDQTRDFVYVKDVVRANIRAMEQEAQGVFNVGTGEPTSIFELANMITDITKIPVPCLASPTRSGDIHESYADISLSRGTLKYEPKYTLRQGLEEMLL